MEESAREISRLRSWAEEKIFSVKEAVKWFFKKYNIWGLIGVLAGILMSWSASQTILMDKCEHKVEVLLDFIMFAWVFSSVLNKGVLFVRVRAKHLSWIAILLFIVFVWSLRLFSGGLGVYISLTTFYDMVAFFSLILFVAIDVGTITE